MRALRLAGLISASIPLAILGLFASDAISGPRAQAKSARSVMPVKLVQSTPRKRDVLQRPPLVREATPSGLSREELTAAAQKVNIVFNPQLAQAAANYAPILLTPSQAVLKRPIGLSAILYARNLYDWYPEFDKMQLSNYYGMIPENVDNRGLVGVKFYGAKGTATVVTVFVKVSGQANLHVTQEQDAPSPIEQSGDLYIGVSGTHAIPVFFMPTPANGVGKVLVRVDGGIGVECLGAEIQVLN